MAKTAMKMTLEEIEKVVERLTPKEQGELANKLRAMRLEWVSQKMTQAVKKNKIMQKDIDRMCKEARRIVYKKSRSRYKHSDKRSS